MALLKVGTTLAEAIVDVEAILEFEGCSPCTDERIKAWNELVEVAEERLRRSPNSEIEPDGRKD